MHTFSSKDGAKQSGLAALLAVTPESLRGGEDYESWPAVAATAAEITVALSASLRASQVNDGSAGGSFDVDRLGMDSYLVIASSNELAQIAADTLDDAGFGIHRSGSVVVCKAEAKKKPVKSTKINAETKKKLVKTAARDMDVLTDSWSMKVAQRLFQEHVGAGDNMVSFMRFLDDLDTLLNKYRNRAKDDEDEEGEGKDSGPGENDHGHDPAEASAADKPVAVTEAAREELAGALDALLELYEAPIKFRVV